MRIRSIKPEFYRSEDIAALDWETRLVFIGLWSYVDDNGVGRDVEKLIVADIFPLEGDPTETLRRVSRSLDVLFWADLIVRYEHDGRPYLFITNWDKHQLVKNPNKPRNPRPDAANGPTREKLRRPYGDSTETLPTGTGEQGNRGTGDSLVPSRTQVTTARTRDDPKWQASRAVQTWIDQQPARPPGKVINDVTAQLTTLFSEGIAIEHIAAGLDEWWKGKYPASTIPNYVANAQRGRGTTATGTQRAADILAIDTNNIESVFK